MADSDFQIKDNRAFDRLMKLVDLGDGTFGVPVKMTGAAAGPSTGTPANVAAATADTVILAANASRKGATVKNDSTAVLFLLLANAVASMTSYTVLLAAGDYYEVPFGYAGVIKGIWAAAGGAARVTEFT